MPTSYIQIVNVIDPLISTRYIRSLYMIPLSDNILPNTGSMMVDRINWYIGILKA